MTRFYRRFMGRLIRVPAWRYGFLLTVVLLLLAFAWISLSPNLLIRPARAASKFHGNSPAEAGS